MRRRYEGVIMAAGKHVPPLSSRREEVSAMAFWSTMQVADMLGSELTIRQRRPWVVRPFHGVFTDPLDELLGLGLFRVENMH